VEELARSLGVSPRHLQRRFVAAVGYGPKTFQRIARFQRLLALAHTPRGVRPGLTDLALDAGYADQAHMTREVGELAGRTPARLLGDAASTLILSDLFELSGPRAGG
jgi:methylphosphotriester-DNA--protein-cysteine methyltransferase